MSCCTFVDGHSSMVNGPGESIGAITSSADGNKGGIHKSLDL